MSRQSPSGSAANARTVAAVLFRLSAQPSEVRALGFGEQSEPTCI